LKIKRASSQNIQSNIQKEQMRFMRYSKTRKVLADRIRETRSLIKISVQQLNEGSPLAGYFVVTYTEQLIKLRQEAKNYGRNKLI
jgi:hypothetical protein